jgi:hypothetical protein
MAHLILPLGVAWLALTQVRRRRDGRPGVYGPGDVAHPAGGLAG